MSQANLDQGVQEYFRDTEDALHYGEVKMLPLAFQDDLLQASKDVLGAQVNNIKMSSMLKNKGLEAHLDKTCFIVCGSKKYKEKVLKDLDRNILTFGDFQVKQRDSDRYLGQVLHGGGLDRCAEATVQDRTGRIKGAATEIKSIIEEFQMQTFGGLMAAWELWEKALVPSLLSGAGTWVGGDKTAATMCDNL